MKDLLDIGRLLLFMRLRSHDMHLLIVTGQPLSSTIQKLMRPLSLVALCLRVSIAVKGTVIMATLIKENIPLGWQLTV